MVSPWKRPKTTRTVSNLYPPLPKPPEASLRGFFQPQFPIIMKLTNAIPKVKGLSLLNTMHNNQSIQKFIESNSVKIPFSGCWLWEKSLTKVGDYGQVGYASYGTEKAHRLSYVAFVRTLTSSEEFICHSCDTPSCVNPNHLFAGSHTDNMRDMISKGRGNYAKIAKRMRKLSPKTVLEIKAIVGKSNPEIAKIYGVSTSTIRLVRVGHHYREIL